MWKHKKKLLEKARGRDSPKKRFLCKKFSLYIGSFASASFSLFYQILLKIIFVDQICSTLQSDWRFPRKLAKKLFVWIRTVVFDWLPSKSAKIAIFNKNCSLGLASKQTRRKRRFSTIKTGNQQNHQNNVKTQEKTARKGAWSRFAKKTLSV